MMANRAIQFTAIRKRWCFAFGLILVILVNLPILLNNVNMVAIIHDEFDFDVVAYKNRAKDLFGTHFIDEFLNGSPALSLTPSALLFSIPYIFFRPELAFFINYLIIVLVAYTGMYLCVDRLTGRQWIAVLTSVIFTMLPFYSVYGLSVMGQPLLLFCFIQLWDKSDILRHKLVYAVIILFGLSSSLALVGYADLFFLFLAVLIGFAKKRGMKAFLIGALLLLATYVVTNIDMIGTITGGMKDFVSHRTEWKVTHVAPFRDSFKSVFQSGIYHAASIQDRMVYPILLVLILSLAFIIRLDRADRQRLMAMAALYGLAVLIAVFYALWHSAPIANLREKLGGLFISFQCDRFYWMYPCIWYILFACALYFSTVLLRKGNAIKYIPIIVFCACNILALWDNSTIKENYLHLADVTESSKYASIGDFYQTDLFEKIDKEIGKPKDSYRVVSVCLYPSIPLYNGFYCLDGYSNYYNINHKHRFREAIAGELERNDSIKSYFDDWGNRCYAFSSELWSYYISKNSDRKIETLNYDFVKLKEMGCEYIMSGVEIQQNGALGFVGSFEDDDSYYRVYLYRLL